MANKILNLAVLGGLSYAAYNALTPNDKQVATKALGFTATPQNEADFMALIKSTIKGDKELQRLLTGTTGSIGPKGDTGEPGQNGQLQRNDGGTNGGGFKYLKGISTGDGECYIKEGGNSSTPSDLLATISRDTNKGIIRVWESGVSGVQIEGNGTASKIGGGSWSSISDERVKDNINYFEKGLAQIILIETKTFQYKKVKGTQTEFYPDSICNKTQYGVIAQQLQAVCPEMVTEDEKGFLSVDLSNIPLMLVNAVKELNAKDIEQQKNINSQKTEISNLKASLKLFEERLATLETKTA